MRNDTIKKLTEKVDALLQKDEKPLTFKEAVEYLGVSKSFLYKLTHTHRIAFYKPAGKMIYFKKSDLDNYLFRNRNASNQELDQIAIDHVTQ